MIEVISDIENRREEWLALKKKTIGASEIATIAGMNPWKTRLQLWAEKTGRVERDEENDFMWLGRQMEPILGKLFERRMKLATIPTLRMYRHDEIEWATATPDFWVLPAGVESHHAFNPSADLAVLQTKHGNANQVKAWEDDVPTPAYIQVQWELGVLGLSRGYAGGLFGGSPENVFFHPIEFNPALFDSLLDIGKDFMRQILEDSPPAATGGDLKFIERNLREDLHVSIDELEALPLIRSYEKLSVELSNLEKTKKDLDTRRKACRARLEQMMGNSLSAKCGPYALQMKRVEVSSYTVDARTDTRFSIKGGLEG